MFPVVRPRSMILLGAAAVVAGVAALGGILLLGVKDAEGKDLGDPDP